MLLMVPKGAVNADLIRLHVLYEMRHLSGRWRRSRPCLQLMVPRRGLASHGPIGCQPDSLRCVPVRQRAQTGLQVHERLFVV